MDVGTGSSRFCSFSLSSSSFSSSFSSSYVTFHQRQNRGNKQAVSSLGGSAARQPSSRGAKDLLCACVRVLLHPTPAPVSLPSSPVGGATERDAPTPAHLGTSFFLSAVSFLSSAFTPHPPSDLISPTELTITSVLYICCH